MSSDEPTSLGQRIVGSAAARLKKFDRFSKKYLRDLWDTLNYVWWDRIYHSLLILYLLFSVLVFNAYFFKEEIEVFESIWRMFDEIKLWVAVLGAALALFINQSRKKLRGEAFWNKIDKKRGFNYAFAHKIPPLTFRSRLVASLILLPLISHVVSFWAGWVTLEDFIRDSWYQWLILVVTDVFILMALWYDVKLRQMLRRYFIDWVQTYHTEALQRFESVLIAHFYEKVVGLREKVGLPIIKVKEAEGAKNKEWLGKTFYDQVNMTVMLFYDGVSFDSLAEEATVALNVENHLRDYYFSNAWSVPGGQAPVLSPPFKTLLGKTYFVGGLPNQFATRTIDYGTYQWDADRMKAFNSQLSYKKVYYQSIDSINYCNDHLKIEGQGVSFEIPLYSKDAAGNQSLTKQIYDLVHPQRDYH